MKLLTFDNTKTSKGEGLGYLSAIMHFAPSRLSGYNVCSFASEGCINACLNTAGMGVFSNVQDGRINKTRRFFEDRDAFFVDLIKDIEYVQRRAVGLGMIPCYRLNGTSDILWERYSVDVSVKYRGKTTVYQGRNIMEVFPGVQFYDYTAVPNRRDIPSNYHLTFSRKENNDDNVAIAIKNGLNVAVVFESHLPDSYMGLPVINGDDNDLRFLDPKGCIVGLVAKGKGRRDTSGFVVLQSVSLPVLEAA